MRLDKLGMVNRIATERTRLLSQIESLPGALGVTISAHYQDEALVHLVAPIVAGELRKRVRALDADLAQLGVAVG